MIRRRGQSNLTVCSSPSDNAPETKAGQVNSKIGNLSLLNVTVKRLVNSVSEDKGDDDMYCEMPITQEVLDQDRDMCRLVSRCAPARPTRRVQHLAAYSTYSSF